MHKIELRFYIRLEDYSRDNPINHYGPIFYKWLPDGEIDALKLKTNNSESILSVWFVRRGYTQDGFIEFDHERREVDPIIMQQQAKLNAGPLSGKLVLSNITEDEFMAITQDLEDHRYYERLGKRVVNLIYPPVSQFIHVLRINLGQYWLRELPKWDSRQESIGSYCANQLQLKWRSDPEAEWRNFHPTKSQIFITLTPSSEEQFSQYLTKEDYFQLIEILEHDNDKALDAIKLSLASAHQNHDNREYSYAIIDGCTALELAMSRRIRNAYKYSKIIKSARDSFFKLPKESQLVYLASFEGSITEENLEQAILAIKLRNDIVHDGYEPPIDKSTDNKIKALLSVTTYLLPGSTFKFPQLNSGNKLF